MGWVEVVAVVGGAVGAIGGTIGAYGGIRGSKAEQRTNELVESQLRLDHDRRHEDLAPKPPPAINADRKTSDAGGDVLTGSITVPRDYRVRGEAISGDTSWPLDLDLVLRANRAYEFEIEKWPPGRTEPRAKELRFRFWPPEEVDCVPAWSCPCDRPLGGGSNARSGGHWEWRVPVEYYDPVASVY
jgi:hypothetical protein